MQIHPFCIRKEKKKHQNKILTERQEYLVSMIIGCSCTQNGNCVSTSHQTYRPMLMQP
jgi:hypothetical protein